MNLTWHIIRKDLQRSRWALVCWAFGLAYLLLQPWAPLQGDNLRDYLQGAAMLLVLVLGVGLIADLVQADHPTQENSHWRALPVSAGRMVTVKLLLIGMIFVVAPVVAVCIRHVFDQGKSLHHASEYGLEGLILAAIVLSLAASAACTRNVLQCLLLWVSLIFGTGTLADFLNRFAPVLSLQGMARMGMTKVLVILTLSSTIALAVILNQYLRRRVVSSAVLLLGGAVAMATVGAFWGYFYFYSTQ